MNISKSDFEYTSCNLCGSENYDTLFIARDWFFELPGEFPVVKCKNCGMVYINPRLTLEAMISYYPKEYYTHKSLAYNKVSANSSNTFNLVIR